MGLTAKQRDGQKNKRLQVISLALILFAVLLLGYAVYKILFVPDLAYRLLVVISLGLILTALAGMAMN